MYKKPKKNNINICVEDDCNNPRHVLDSGRKILKCKDCMKEDYKTRGKSLWKNRKKTRDIERENIYKPYYLFSDEYKQEIAEY